MRAVVAETGVLQGKSRRALDSVVLDDAVDRPEARHVHKTVHHRRDGYKAHLAVEPDTGIFTADVRAKASGDDNHEAVIGLRPLDSADGAREVLGDSAYGTGNLRAELAAHGHTAIIKPAPLRPAVENGFTLDDFIIDEAAVIATYPNGIIHRITATRAVTFGKACANCPLPGQCTISKNGRILHLHPHAASHKAARAHRLRVAEVCNGGPRRDVQHAPASWPTRPYWSATGQPADQNRYSAEYWIERCAPSVHDPDGATPPWVCKRCT